MDTVAEPAIMADHSDDDHAFTVEAPVDADTLNLQDFIWGDALKLYDMGELVFARVGAAMADPSQQAALQSIRLFHVAPIGAGDESAQQLADFLSTTESLTSLSLDYMEPTCAPAHVCAYVDQWLKALTSNEAIQLNCLNLAGFTPSLPVVRGLVQAKLQQGTLAMDACFPHHIDSLTDYLDPTMGVKKLSISLFSEPTERLLERMQSLLPLTQTLDELVVDFLYDLGQATCRDIAALFVSSSVRKLRVKAGLLRQLPPNATLRELDLHGTKLGADASYSLGELTSLESLSLRGCQVGSNQSLTLQAVLAANHSSLRRVCLEHNNFGGTEWSNDLLAFLYKSRAIKSLTIKRMDLSAAFLHGLHSYLLSKACCLESLVVDVCGNDLDPSESLLLCQAVRQCQSLKQFVLEPNSVRDLAVARALVAALDQNPRLTCPCVDDELFEAHDGETERAILAAKFDRLNQLNWFGRRLWHSDEVPSGVWPILLARIDAVDEIEYEANNYFVRKATVDATGVLFDFLRAMPDLLIPRAA